MVHLFLLDEQLGIGILMLPLGSPLKMSHTPEWPPAILFNTVYTDAVLHHFGAQTLKDEVTKTWKETYSEVMTAAHTNYKVITDEQAALYRESTEPSMRVDVDGML